ncbi:class I SAM-dependent methyltransferase [Clostridium thailandense]|uniref:class I SAM-dependent methyltransferase n=1 Tax=Clostridium thailandense TaxID=2794346 RepID=UPI001FDE60B1|nr:SAM-dependent methyltransferase [Clostridiaceae bacterium UIB06]
MDWILFLKQYVKKPTTVGALLPSSEHLAEKMIENINFKQANCIVEYGPGTGVFTEKLVKNRISGTKIILIEYNLNFYKILVNKYRNEKDIYIINDSAENIDIYLKTHNLSKVDYIVSGLPFASLSKEVSRNILNTTRTVLNKDGKFITFQYTLLKKSFINQFFSKISIKRELLNLPPAYVFCCSNQV